MRSKDQVEHQAAIVIQPVTSQSTPETHRLQVAALDSDQMLGLSSLLLGVLID